MTGITNAQQPSGSLEAAIQHGIRLLAANPLLALEQAQEILKLVPSHPVAALITGVAHRLLGNLAIAEQILVQLATAQPRSAETFFELGMTLAESGQIEAAVAALRRAVYLKPAMPDAWRTIGDLLGAQGDTKGADAAYAQHLKASTQDPRLLTAANAMCENDIPRTEALLRAHLKQHPTDVAAIRMLAEVGGRLGRYEDAEKLLSRALELAPSFAAARHNYALVLHRQNRHAEALTQLEKLLEVDPLNSGYRNLKAVVLAKIGDFPQSLDIYADVLAKHPNEAKIWLSYGHSLASAGRQSESIAAYRRAITLMPDNGEPWWSLANLKTFRFEERELEEMRTRLADTSLADDSRATFHFALAKAYEDVGQYANSFQNYERGNELRLAKLGYDPEIITDHVSRSRALLTRQFFSERAGYGSPAADPIFIVGLPRAGSTLIEQILASHSTVEGTMELPNIMGLVTQLRDQVKLADSPPAYPELLASLSPDACRQLGEQYLRETRIQRRTDKPYFIDKMPNNFLHLGLIRLALPNAKIIDARRHPMACCFSGFKQNFAHGQRFSYSLTHLARYYRDYVALMAHFDDALPGAIHRVIYEEMIDDTDAAVRSLLAFCGLPFEHDCLRFYENERAVRTASAQQVRRPIYRDAVDQWRHFESWLKPLEHALGDVLLQYPHAPSTQTHKTMA